ncbi:MAG: aspartate 1-decarboxylase [Thermodesulfobacteriota bacterium]|nr:aspartate 1-decarboxylase [Thermodesulfobacteriota bacterium]
MLRSMLKSKIHKATITQADLLYNGSLTIDSELMAAVDLYPFERIKVYNIENGERFDTYAIEGEPGSGVIGLNGAAARKGLVGDRIIIVSYSLYSREDLVGFNPQIIVLDGNNRISERIAADFSSSSLVTGK